MRYQKKKGSDYLFSFAQLASHVEANVSRLKNVLIYKHCLFFQLDMFRLRFNKGIVQHFGVSKLNYDSFMFVFLLHLDNRTLCLPETQSTEDVEQIWNKLTETKMNITLNLL